MKSFNNTPIKASFCLIFIFVFGAIGCAKLVGVNAPVTSTTGETVFTSDATATAVLTGIYTNMSSAFYGFATGGNSISVEAGLSADELALYPGTTSTALVLCYQNGLTNQVSPAFWTSFYQVLLTVNSAIDGLSGATSLNPSVRQQLQGEAKFMRAFCYFYLVNFYGDVPLITTSDYKVNALLPRTPKSKVYQQIIADLKDAQSLLSSNYLDATLLKQTTERVRPTKWAATALLARTYLYTGSWDSAEVESTSLISNSGLYTLSTLTGAFLKTSLETIWQLQPVISGQNTLDGNVFIMSSGPNTYYNSFLVSPSLLNSFEVNDGRRSNWVGTYKSGSTSYYYPYKYKVQVGTGSPTEYLIIFRLAEQYLIRAEARARKEDTAGAMSDLTVIRSRANLPKATASTQSALLAAIQHERQVELFTEWGHRWLDLKRTNAIDSVMSAISPQKGGTWNTNWQFYPIPLSDLQTDANLAQNTGY